MYRRLAVFTLAVLPVVSCDDTGTARVDYTATLAAMTDGVAVPEMTTLATDADALVTKVKAFHAAPSASTLASAQIAWRAARADWRKLDAVYFGPTLDLGISNRIDASPAATSDIEAAIAGTATLDDTFVANLGGKAKGFLGDEYLLFSAQGSDAALTTLTGTDGARRRQLAISIADEIASSSHQLLDAWTKDGTTPAYATLVKTAGAGSTRYARQLTAISDYVNGVNAALDTVTMRIRLNLGGGTPDPSTDPTSASDSAVADMKASLFGANAIWAGMGLSTKVPSSTMVTEANAAQSDCAQKLAAIPTPYDDTLTSQTPVIQAVYDTCDAWKKKWATDLTASLGVVISPEQDGD